MSLKRIVLFAILLSLTACNRPKTEIIHKYNIGIVNYGENDKTLKKYTEFEKYIGAELSSAIELEPTYNEIRALQQISTKKWDLVFAPPGLAAIAVSHYGYQPIMPLDGNDKSRSVIVVKNNSPYQQRQDLSGKTITLGQKGSATGYYLPLYNLYGVNLADTLYAPTPKEILQWVNEARSEAGALSLAEYNLYRRDFAPNTFRVLHLDQHDIPPGAILVSDRIERNQEAMIITKLSNTPSFISASAGFLPNERLPDYDYLIKVIKRVQEINQGEEMYPPAKPQP